MGDAQSIPPRSDHAQSAANWVSSQRRSLRRQLVHAAIVADANAVHAPGALLLEGGEVLACGTPQQLGAPTADMEHETRANALICPPLVNAHAHLDLSACPVPDQGSGFDAWLSGIREHRIAQAAEQGAIEHAVQRGVVESLQGGCGFVGDISGSKAALSALRASPLAGCGFLEFLGHGERAQRAATLIDEIVASDSGHERVRLGISPHAPISTGELVYQRAAASGLPVATHLAESPEELAWCQDGSGPFQALLESSGYEPGAVQPPGAHPLDVFLPLLPGRRAVGVHLNYIDEGHLEALATSGVGVVYCPRASRYFGHPRPGGAPHVWREMLACGIPVALGTDGRPCLPGPGMRGERLSVLDDAICLIQEDGARLEEWIALSTVHGARALGLERSQVTLEPGRKRGLVAIELEAPDRPTLTRDARVEWLFFDEQAPVRFESEDQS